MKHSIVDKSHIPVISKSDKRFITVFPHGVCEPH